MAVRQRSDPSGALARVQANFKGGFSGVRDALKRRQELQDAIRKLLTQERIAERTPERQVERIGLEAAQRAGRDAQPPGGFSRAEREQPQALERAFQPVREERMRKALSRFGLIKPSAPGGDGAGIEALRELLGGRAGGGQPSVDGTGGIASEVEAFGVTGLTFDPATGSTKISFGETPAGKAARETKTQVTKDLAKRRRETQEGFQRTIGLMTNFVSQFKSKLKAQPGEKGGIIPGVVGNIQAALKLPGSSPIAAVKGQRKETALALNSVLTGQNRVIRGVVEMILETLPTDLDTEEFMEQKISQTLRNAFMLLKANNTGLLTKEILEGFNSEGDGSRLKSFLLRNASLTGDEQQIIQTLVDQVLGSPEAGIEAQQGQSGTTTGFRIIQELP